MTDDEIIDIGRSFPRLTHLLIEQLDQITFVSAVRACLATQAQDNAAILQAATRDTEPSDGIPEGCTPADAQMLRLANHGLAQEIDRYRVALSDLCLQIHTFAEKYGEADFETGRAEKLLQSADGKSVSFLTDHERIELYELRDVAEQAAIRDDFEARFIAEHGHRLASLFGINAFDLADRDAQIMAVLAATRDAPSADAVDAQRYRWLLAHPEHVEFGDFYDRTWLGPMATVSDAIDAAIAAYAPKESK